MRFCSLASGSKGNAYLVDDAGELILIDCGIGLRTLKTRMALAGVAIDDITAVLITHEHSDHVAGLAAFQRLAPDVPVFMNFSTADAVCALYPDVCDEMIVAFENDSRFPVGDLKVWAIETSHDVSDPVGYFVEGPGGSYFHITDTGEPTVEMDEYFDMADVATLESNHDLALLRSSGRPYHVVRRIEGPCGHLSNDQAADFVASCAVPRLKHLALAHLSQDCNSPHLALDAVAKGLACAGCCQTKLTAFSQCRVSDWIYA